MTSRPMIRLASDRSFSVSAMSDTPKHDLDDLFRAIGQVAVTWAYLETAVTTLVDAIWLRWGGKDLGEPLPKTAMSRKTEFLKLWFNSDPKWQTTFPDFDDIPRRVDQASRARHQIIHGIAADIHEFPDTGTTSMVRIVSRTERRVTTATIKLSVDDIIEFRNAVLRLAVAVGAAAEIFGGHPGTDDGPDKSLRELLTQLT